MQGGWSFLHFYLNYRYEETVAYSIITHYIP